MKNLLITSTISLSLLLSACSSEDKNKEPVNPNIIKPIKTIVPVDVKATIPDYVDMKHFDMSDEILIDPLPVSPDTPIKEKKNFELTIPDLPVDIISTKTTTENMIDSLPPVKSIGKKVSIDSIDFTTGKCTTCHGTDWSKSAMNISKPVSEMSAEEIFLAMKGYKDGTYGSTMKSLMKAQIKKYSNSELFTISEFIKNNQ